MGSFSRRLVCLPALFALASCWNYSSDGRITVERSVSAGNVSPGQTFVLTTVLRNQTGAPLEGVFLTEHLPAGLRVDGAAVEVDLADVTHRARLENGASGDVWAGCTPCRVVLWSPGEVPDPVAVASVLAVDLRLAVDAPGVYDLGRNNWAGRIAGGESVFGWGEASLRIVCPDASGFVPYPLDVASELSTTGRGESPAITQTHRAAAFQGFMPDAMRLTFDGGRFDFDGVGAGDIVGEAQFNVDYPVPGGASGVHVQGTVVIDLRVSSVGPTLQCEGIVRSAPASIDELLRAWSVIGPGESLQGRRLGSLELGSDGTGASATWSLDAGVPRDFGVSWDIALAWSLRDGLYTLPWAATLAVATRYVFEGVSTPAHAQTFVLSGGMGEGAFMRADANADGFVDISDAIAILVYLFGDGALPCEKAADVNDDGRVDVADAVYALSYLFAGGREPPAPFGTCGTDPTADMLTCEAFLPCGK